MPFPLPEIPPLSFHPTFPGHFYLDILLKASGTIPEVFNIIRMESVWVEVQEARCEEVELILPLVPRPLYPQILAHWTLLLPEHTAPSDSRSLLMLFFLPGILSSLHPSLISGKHLLYQGLAQTSPPLGEAIQGPLVWGTLLPLVPKRTRVCWPHCW